MTAELARNWWLLLIRGVLAVLFGVLLIFLAFRVRGMGEAPAPVV